MNNQWWELPTDDPKIPQQVVSALQELKSQWQTRYARWDRVDELVGTSEATTGFWHKSLQFNGSILEYSVIKSVRDAMRARLATRRPKVRAYTAGARYTVREKARQLTKLIKGIFNRSDIYTKNHQIFNDVLDYGIGYAKPYEINGQIKIDRVNPRQILMDEPDYGDPTLWYHFFDVPKSQLIEGYSDFEDEINESGVLDLSEGSDTNRDYCTVIEAWYTPQNQDGRHVILTNKATLIDDTWESDSPGVVPVRFYEPTKGFVGENLVDVLGDIQDQIYYLLAKIQDYLDLAGTLKVFVDAGSQCNMEILNNELIQVFKHNGQKGVPIQIVQIPPIDPVYFQQLDRLEAKAYSLVGLNELWASSQKPAGLNSGRAISEMDDITSTRFLHISQKEDSWYTSLGRSCLTLGTSIPGFSVVLNGERIAWKDIKLNEDEYDLTVAAVSQLPDTSPGIIQKIIDDSQLDAQIAADQLVLFDSLDHEAYIRQLIAPKLACDKYLDEIFYDHKDAGLNPNLDLNYLQKKALLVYNQAYLTEDSKAQDMLLDLMANIDSTLERMQKPELPPMPLMPDASQSLPPQATPNIPGPIPQANESLMPASEPQIP